MKIILKLNYNQIKIMSKLRQNYIKIYYLVHIWFEFIFKLVYYSELVQRHTQSDPIHNS